MKPLIKQLLRERLLESTPNDKLSELNIWYNTEKKKLEKIENYKLWELKNNALLRHYFKLKDELSKKYGDEVYGLGGNINATYLYHFTTGDSLIEILEDNQLLTGENGISFTTNGNLYKSKFIFYYPSKYDEGKHWENVGIRLKFDFNLMKRDGLKFKIGNEHIDTNVGEYEIRLRQDELDNISKYLLEIAIFKDKEKNYLQIIDILKEKNIKYIVI